MVVISKARRMQSQLRLLRHERGLILDPAPNLPELCGKLGDGVRKAA